jgi:hypothetical protein
VRSRLVAAFLVGGALLLPGCRKGPVIQVVLPSGTPSVSGSGVSPSPTASPPITASPPSSSPAPLPPTTPEITAVGLYNAWVGGEQGTAAVYATSQAIGDIFGQTPQPGSAGQFLSCQPEGDVGRACSFQVTVEGGGPAVLTMHILGNAANGYRVESVDFAGE